MNRKMIPLLFASAAILSACNGNSATATPAIAKEDAIAVVNGKFISKKSLEALEKDLAQRSRGQSFPQDKLIDELVQRQLLIQDAELKQLDKTPDFIERLTLVRESLLSQAAIQNFLQANPITDADLQAEYDKTVANAGTEYKARHILLKTEEEAKQVIADLTKGADFAELAKTKSTGPSGPQGGDLGWFTADRMVAPFSEAVVALEDNKFTIEPVQTQFGWHVILREGSRDQTPPPLEAIKEQLRPVLQRQKVQDFMKSLRDQAKIEVLLTKENDNSPTAIEPADTTEK